uniref:Uncharacterized protein n=1 Tax=Tetradesmus obliquus TaxID=3088 RepID=A0A383VIZ3_TETOB|eukprot:jgi/Sobl393_1/5972/SZX65507.1
MQLPLQQRRQQQQQRQQQQGTAQQQRLRHPSAAAAQQQQVRRAQQRGPRRQTGHAARLQQQQQHARVDHQWRGVPAGAAAAAAAGGVAGSSAAAAAAGGVAGSSAAAAAAGPGAAGISEAEQLLSLTVGAAAADPNWRNDRAMVDLMSNVAQMERERAKTERDRNDKVLRLVMYGVDVLKGGAGAAGGPGLLPGGNLQALPAGMAGARLVEEEAD